MTREIQYRTKSLGLLFVISAIILMLGTIAILSQASAATFQQGSTTTTYRYKNLAANTYYSDFSPEQSLAYSIWVIHDASKGSTGQYTNSYGLISFSYYDPSAHALSWNRIVSGLSSSEYSQTGLTSATFNPPDDQFQTYDSVLGKWVLVTVHYELEWEGEGTARSEKYVSHQRTEDTITHTNSQARVRDAAVTGSITISLTDIDTGEPIDEIVIDLGSLQASSILQDAKGGQIQVSKS